MGLRDNLLRGIYSYGFEKPSRIQATGIMPILNRRDVILQAPSGSGKTAAFTIPLLQNLDSATKACQALVLVPTRELASQIRKVRVAFAVCSCAGYFSAG
jgi:superfamily II DNA/RNA helicase